MLELKVSEKELFNDDEGTFVAVAAQTLELEHSLISVSKWESKWRKPFLIEGKHDPEAYVDYIRCMCITRNVPEEVFLSLSSEEIQLLTEYIDTEQTATWFNETPGDNKPKPTQAITSELIYYWMIAYNVPAEYQKWPLSRLLTLIRVCEAKNAPQKKQSKAELHARMRALNAERRAKQNGKG